MKKIIALAVAGAFAAPVMAADVNLSGSVEASYNDTNGTTVTATDTIFTISASTETATGISVSGDINIASDNDGVAGDGSNSLTLSGPFGSLDAGDTSSAADKYDDRNDYGKLNGVATDAGDAAIGWTLPTMVEGLSVYVSHATDTNADSEAMKHTGVALQYVAGPVSLAVAKNEEEAAESNVSYAGVTVTFQGLAISAESMEDEAGGTSSKVDEDIIGAKYTMGDLTAFMVNSEVKTGGSKSAEVSSYGLHYNMGGDTSSAADKYDDRNDYAKLNGVATDAGDAAIGWTLPSIVEGLSVYVSHATDTNADSEAMKHTGVALQYVAGPVSLALAKNEEEAAESNVSYAGVTVTFQGLAISAESMEDEAGGTTTKVDEDIVGAKYTMGDLTAFVANSEVKTGGSKSAEVSSYGLHYNMGGGVTFFVEASQDDLNSALDKTGAGIVMAF